MPGVEILKPARHVGFGEACRFWLELGFISFGGPAGQIAIMHRELVERRRWISEARFLHALNYCMLLPGPEAQQLATYLGWLLHRTWGGLIAGALFVLPSVFILLGLSYVYAAYGSVPLVAAILGGVKPVVVAVVVEAVLRIGRRALRRRVHVAIAALAFVGIYFLHVPFPVIVLGSGLVGLTVMRLRPDLLAEPKGATAPVTSQGAAAASHEPMAVVIEDEGPLPPHTQPSRSRAIRVVACWVVLWAAPFLALAIWRGGDSLHAREYVFFSQVALVTFGGAYAVLAYVTQAVVVTYGWLTHAQAVDGLALAETTPGPLIMALQFVGYMAAWNHPEGLSPATSAVVGALVTTYVTFLPSFFFIFLGAPYIEVLRGNRALTAALSGVTAAIVGVILDLALVFGGAVFWPADTGAGFDGVAALVAMTALVVLYRFKVNILWVVVAGGMFGVVRALY